MAERDRRNPHTKHSFLTGVPKGVQQGPPVVTSTSQCSLHGFEIQFVPLEIFHTIIQAVNNLRYGGTMYDRMTRLFMSRIEPLLQLVILQGDDGCGQAE